MSTATLILAGVLVAVALALLTAWPTAPTEEDRLTAELEALDAPELAARYREHARAARIIRQNFPDNPRARRHAAKLSRLARAELAELHRRR